jgi:hypothetical protein
MRIFISIIVLLFILPLQSIAVDFKTAGRVALNFVRSQFPEGGRYSVSDISAIRENGEAAIYIVNLSPQGWLLVSSDYRAEPILGFSYNSKFSLEPDEGHPVNYWLTNYKKQIADIKDIAGIPKNKKWDTYEYGITLKSSTLYEEIEPLIKVKWDQDEGWNKYCPIDLDGPGGRTYVGCVGVAMAQAMSVFKYPVKGENSVSYTSDYGYIYVNYDSVKDYHWNEMKQDSADDYNAKILYHSAASVKMNFGVDGSGTLTSYVPYAITRYFKYSDSVKFVKRYEDDTKWKELLINELSSGRPVVYNGYPDTINDGHAFNIDGVASNGFFHLNWGWNGKYDGYFHINDLTPGMNQFTKNQGAVIGIRPPIAKPTDLVLSDTIIDARLTAGSFVAQIIVSDEVDDNKYSLEVFGKQLPDGTYDSHPFFIENDTIKTLYDLDPYIGDSIEITIVVTDIYSNVYQEQFNLVITNINATREIVNPDIFKVYPNPVDDLLNIILDGMDGFCFEIYSVNGVLKYSAKVYENNIILDLSDYPPGLYIFKIRGLKNKRYYTDKIIKY